MRRRLLNEMRSVMRTALKDELRDELRDELKAEIERGMRMKIEYELGEKIETELEDRYGFRRVEHTRQGPNACSPSGRILCTSIVVTHRRRARTLRMGSMI